MYLALYRKWRPKTFEDVVGQEHITLTLKNEVKSNRIAHAYLFTGPRGTGKTTCSKILAMAVNCHQLQDGNPCRQCESCIGIENSSILDVVEIDAASNNGVDNIRQLREEAVYTPSQCKYRVYIIDEAHMLSAGAFNALLKIMEEPPSHVIFILATTEVHKLPATILSRCQRFDFRRFKPEDIAGRLMYIAENESEAFTLEQDAADLIAVLADGGMRDAISLLDQCVAYSRQVSAKTVADAAGIVGKEYLYKLAEHIINGDAAAAVMLLNELYSMSKELQSLLEELIVHFRNIMLTKTLENPTELISVLPDEQERIRAEAKRIELSAVLHCIAELQDCLDRMNRSVDRRLCMELCLIRICIPALSSDKAAINARLDRLEAVLKGGADFTQPAEQPLTAQTPAAQPIVPQPLATQPIAVQPQDDGEVALLMEWAEIMNEIKEKDEPLWAILNGSRAYTHAGFLYIESPRDFAATVMRQEGNAQKLVAAVAAKTGMRYKLRIKSNTQSKTEKEPERLNSILDKARSMGVEIRE